MLSRSFLSGLLALGHALSAVAAPQYRSTPQQYSPKLYSVGSAPQLDGLHSYSSRMSVTLSNNSNNASRVLTLDFASEVAGWPWLEVTAVNLKQGPVQVELKYSEEFNGLNSALADGPWLYSYGLMNSFRTETFNITQPGQIQSYFLQGGQRWMSVTLLTGASVTIRAAGFEASVSVIEPENLPGTFSSSNSTFDAVWGLGARAVQAACIDEGSQTSLWDISSEGAYIRGQYPAVTSKSTSDWNLYTLEFSTKIDSGGTGWKMVTGPSSGYGAYFVLTSNTAGLASAALEPLPLNSLTVGYGFSIIQQALLPSANPETLDVNMTIQNDVWYRIKTVVTADRWAVYVNDTLIADVDATPFQSAAQQVWGSGSLSAGSFGFGPWYSQAAWFRDVQLTAANGTVLYTNSLTDDVEGAAEDTLLEYAVHANPQAVCLDGPKRDRDAWIGDFAHTARSILVSSGRVDYIKSMIELEFTWSSVSGEGHNLVPIAASIGTDAAHAFEWYTGIYGESDYEFFFMVVMGEYFAATNDTQLFTQYWDQAKAFMAAAIDVFVDPSTHLVTLNNVAANGGGSASFFTAQGETTGTAPTALFIKDLRLMTKIATVLGDSTSAGSWSALAKTMTDGINLSTWTGSYYGVSPTNMGTSSLLATAFTIQGGVATNESASGSINNLAGSLLNIGYKDTSAAGNSLSTQLSPNTQGFLLEALFEAYLTLNISVDIVLPAIITLTTTYWPVMVNQNQYYSGASWEYTYADGSPGIGLFTSLGHPWGGAPTYVYTNYLLGIRTEWNNALGQFEWIFDPVFQVASALGLTWAKGTVPLASGGSITASWQVNKQAPGGYTTSVRVVGNRNVKVRDATGGGEVVQPVSTASNVYQT